MTEPPPSSRGASEAGKRETAKRGRRRNKATKPEPPQPEPPQPEPPQPAPDGPEGPKLGPHPFVLRVATGLRWAGAGNLTKPADDLNRAIKAANPQARGAGPQGPGDDDDFKALIAPDVAFVEKTALATELAQEMVLRDLTLFAGYLGPILNYFARDWRLIYLDERLQEWLLAPTKDIAHEQRQEDKQAAFGFLDAIWVTANADVIQGRGPAPMERMFVEGPFTRAADVAPAPAGGTFAAASGLFCEARSGSCCWGRRSRR
jgi:hypothetical protein